MDDGRRGLKVGEGVAQDLAEGRVVSAVAEEQDAGDGRGRELAVAQLQDAAVQVQPVGVRARVRGEGVVACGPVDEVVVCRFVGLVGALQVGEGEFEGVARVGYG